MPATPTSSPVPRKRIRKATWVGLSLRRAKARNAASVLGGLAHGACSFRLRCTAATNSDATRAVGRSSRTRAGTSASAEIQPLQLVDPAQRRAADPLEVCLAGEARVDREVERLAAYEHQGHRREQITRRVARARRIGQSRALQYRGYILVLAQLGDEARAAARLGIEELAHVGRRRRRRPEFAQ